MPALRDAREPVTLFVEYEGADDLLGDYAENLSSGGTFVATNRELPIGTRVNLVLSFPGLLEPISIEGTVSWARREGEEGDAAHGFERAQPSADGAGFARRQRLARGDGGGPAKGGGEAREHGAGGAPERGDGIGQRD